MGVVSSIHCHTVSGSSDLRGMSGVGGVKEGSLQWGVSGVEWGTGGYSEIGVGGISGTPLPLVHPAEGGPHTLSLPPGTPAHPHTITPSHQCDL